jgi:hypothetical protein
LESSAITSITINAAYHARSNEYFRPSTVGRQRQLRGNLGETTGQVESVKELALAVWS